MGVRLPERLHDEMTAPAHRGGRDDSTVADPRWARAGRRSDRDRGAGGASAAGPEPARNEMDGGAAAPVGRTGARRPQADAEAVANDTRVAVCLSFDTDTEAPLLRDGTTSPTTLSASDFGAESGTPRILRMLEHYQIPATFFMTAVERCCIPTCSPRS